MAGLADYIQNLRQQQQSNNVYNTIASSVLGANVTNPNAGNGTNFVANLVKGLGGGLLQNLGQADNRSFDTGLNSLYGDIFSGKAPAASYDGLDDSQVQDISGGLGIFKQQAAQDQADAKQKAFLDLFGKVGASAVEKGKATPAAVLDAFKDPSKIDALLSGSEKDKIPLGTEDPALAALADPAGPQLGQGGQSTFSKTKARALDLVNSGAATPATAMTAASKLVADELKANVSSVDDAANARADADRLRNLAQTAQAGKDIAGQTGPYNGLAHGADYLMSLFGNTDAAQKVQGDSLLESIGPEVIKSNRSPGSVSDYESKALIKAGPTTTNTPEANQALIDKINYLADIKSQYADFIEAFKQQNSGSTLGAGKLWEQYKKDNPLVVDGNINTNLTPWQQYFTPGATTGADSPSTGSIESQIQAQLGNSVKIKSIKKIK